MKKTVLKKFIACIFAFTTLFATTIFAENVTKQKLTLTYNQNENTLEMGVYIAKGTAIVGYCSFDYDESILTLVDNDKNELPSTIPNKSDDGSVFISTVVEGQNGVEITDVGKGSSKLIDTEDGHLFFAWFLPSSIPFIDATSDEVLIATATFKLADDASAEDLKNDSVCVAGKEITNKVSGWFPGLVVLDKDQKKFSYDGKVSGTALFESELIIDGEVVEAPDVDVETPDVDVETPDVDVETPDVDVETPDVDVETPDVDVETPDVEAPDVDVEAPDVDVETPKSDIEISGEAQAASKENFDLTLYADENSVKVKWTHLNQDGITGYTIFLLDENYNNVTTISGISEISSSYTISNIEGGRKYFVYVIAKAGTKYYSSEIVSCTTDKTDEPETIVSNVFYNVGDGLIYGLSSEMCVFGSSPSKTPTVYAPDGKYFAGWSIDEKTAVDIETMPIYTDTMFYALYTDKKPTVNGYINGYEDGTFKPDGNITRAEAALIISRLCDDYDKDMIYSHEFSDVQKGYWYENAVAYCYNKGYIKGYDDGTFGPYGNITRAEFATILYRVFDFEGVLGVNVFSDLEGHWGKNSISILYGASVVTPDEDGKFRPDEKLTRADAVDMISGAMNVIPDRQGILESVKKDGYKFSDVPQYSEYFFDIYSALMN